MIWIIYIQDKISYVSKRFIFYGHASQFIINMVKEGVVWLRGEGMNLAGRVYESLSS